jgi:hypothetical protein
MKFKSIFIGISAILLLAACNSGGGTTTNDVQTSTVNNGTANISITATGCMGISSNGGQCTVSINYSAPSNSPVITNTTYLNLSGLNGYANNMPEVCSTNYGFFSTTNKNCVITITSQGSTSSAQQALIFPAGYQATQTSFTVGGGI